MKKVLLNTIENYICILDLLKTVYKNDKSIYDIFDKYICINFTFLETSSFEDLLFVKILSKELNKINNLTILDVCCGKREMLSTLNLNYDKINYISIDKDTNILKLNNFKHITQDIDKYTENNIDLQLNFFNMIIIDKEPHGDEIKIYENFKKYLKDEHIIIIPHIICIDWFGSNLAKKFIKHMEENDNLIDYIFYDGFNKYKKYLNIKDINGLNIRDLYIVATKYTNKYDGSANKFIENYINNLNS